MAKLSELNGSTLLAELAMGDKLPVTDVSDIGSNPRGRTKPCLISTIHALFRQSSACFDATTMFMADGSDERATLDLAIAAVNVMSGGRGGTVLLPGKLIGCNNLNPGDNITLRGPCSAYRGVVDGGTRLVATANNSVIRIAGASSASRRFNVVLENITIDGGGFSSAVVDIEFASYVTIYRCHVTNTTGRGIWMREVWDSLIFWTWFTYCGNSAGTIGALEIDSHSTDYSNQIYGNVLRFEECPGTSIMVKGANTNEIRFNDNKVEARTTIRPLVTIASSVNVDLGNMQFTAGGTGTLPTLLQITGSDTVRGEVTMEVAGGGKTITNWASVGTSRGVKLHLGIANGMQEPASGNIYGYDGANAATNELQATTGMAAAIYTVGNVPHMSEPVLGNTEVATGRALTKADNGKTIECSAAGLTLTLPAGLGDFRCEVIPNGTTSIASSGGTLLNGATTTLTRTAAANAMVNIRSRASAVNSYVVTGS